MQQTLLYPVECKGIAVHSGIETSLKICPAQPDSGIVFIRSDLPSNNIVPAYFDRVVDTSMCTKIANDSGASVATIEHLMAALFGAGIDNASIYVDGPEIPIMDGSAVNFIQILKKGKIKKQNKNRNIMRVLKTVKVELEDKYILIEPDHDFSVDCSIDFDNQYIGSQRHIFSFNDNFEDEIAKARTFGFVSDIEQLQKMGLAKGASLNNAIAIDKNGILNDDGLRYQDEFVRHKILDCIGDLYLSGFRIKGKVKSFKAGHLLNNLLLKALFKQNATSLMRAA